MVFIFRNHLFTEMTQDPVILGVRYKYEEIR